MPAWQRRLICLRLEQLVRMSDREACHCPGKDRRRWLRDDARVPMIYVSHDNWEVKRIANRVVRLEAGKVAAAGGVELL